MKMIIICFSEPGLVHPILTFTADLESLQPEENQSVSEAVPDCPVILNLGPGAPLFKILKQSCINDCSIQLTLSKIKTDKPISRDPAVESVTLLSEAEFMNLKLSSEGLSYREIAKKRNVELETVKTQMTSIYFKLQIPDNKAPTACALYRNFIQLYPFYVVKNRKKKKN